MPGGHLRQQERQRRDRRGEPRRVHPLRALRAGGAAGHRAREEALRRNRARTLNERRTSPVELLWDLVFVFAVTQVTTLIADDLSWSGIGQGLVVLALVWWAWSAFVWVANATDPTSPSFRLALVAALVSAYSAGLALPRQCGDEATVFAVSYAI